MSASNPLTQLRQIPCHTPIKKAQDLERSGLSGCDEMPCRLPPNASEASKSGMSTSLASASSPSGTGSPTSLSALAAAAADVGRALDERIIMINLLWYCSLLCTYNFRPSSAKPWHRSYQVLEGLNLFGPAASGAVHVQAVNIPKLYPGLAPRVFRVNLIANEAIDRKRPP